VGDGNRTRRRRGIDFDFDFKDELLQRGTVVVLSRLEAWKQISS